MTTRYIKHLRGRPLTQKEFEVAYLFSQGIRGREIARRLELSYWSIHEYRKRIYIKLGLNNIDQLIKWAEKEGV